MRLNNYHNRKLEWSVATYTLAFGLFLMLPQRSMSASFLDLKGYMSEPFWGLLYGMIGLLHLIALHINGRAAWTPFVRVIAAAISSQVFLATSVSIAAVNPFSTGAFTYVFLAMGFCGPCILSASRDVGRELKIREARNARH